MTQHVKVHIYWKKIINAQKVSNFHGFSKIHMYTVIITTCMHVRAHTHLYFFFKSQGQELLWMLDK